MLKKDLSWYSNLGKWNSMLIEKACVMPYYIVIRERAAAWDWSVPMRQQAEWHAHAAFMNALANKGFIAAGGPLGEEDDAARLLHVLNAHVEMEAASIERIMAEDPWTPMGLLKTVSIEPWTILLGGFDCPECGSLSRQRPVGKT